MRPIDLAAATVKNTPNCCFEKIGEPDRHAVNTEIVKYQITLNCCFCSMKANTEDIVDEPLLWLDRQWIESPSRSRSTF
ncbi:hypothetical protein C7B77_01775 [Chamaesiphon polymorphus CCALA 037]|uniref:Uncharacterized protein n=1 Tax=Chamaesiphon polymorphus CCALA 037 TaxID=2107692 RepID=A0A2T1GMS3_9CYAN|nr:hypothetical protein C7B77_01775 [Chamaesiphon polymorphus CCALA 037]